MIKMGEAFLLDEDVLIKGTVKRKGLKKIFVPDENIQCGFSYQELKQKDNGKILFYNSCEINNAGFGNLEIAK